MCCTDRGVIPLSNKRGARPSVAAARRESAPSTGGFQLPPALGPEALIAGLPRSGTTLALTLLQELSRVIPLDEALREPELRLANTSEDIAAITRRFLREQRRLAQDEGIVWTFNKAGAVSSDQFDGPIRNEMRTRTVHLSWARIPHPFTPRSMLLLKQPVVFTAAIDVMAQIWPMVGIIRNPIAVLGSWNSVDFGIRQGRVVVPERLHPSLQQSLEAIPNQYDRQVALVHWFLGRLKEHLPAERLIRYEDLIPSGGSILSVLVPEAASLRKSLETRNRPDAYDPRILLEVGERMLASEGPAWDLYSKAEASALLDDMLSGGVSLVP